MIPVVLTGQQIGLLGGPLYTTYKVLGAIHRARELNGRAVFWLETNDADFSEINYLDFLDGDDQLQNLTWNIDSLGFSVGYMVVTAELIGLLEKYFSSLKPTPHTPVLKQLVLDCYQLGVTLGEASRLMAQRLYGSWGIEIFDPAQKEFREFSRTFLETEAEHTPVNQQANLFVIREHKRLAVFRSAQGFQLRDGTPIDLEAFDLVPNLKTRNICQDAYFKTHTYIAGPAERKYIAELLPRYEFHGVVPPRVEPRMSITLIEPRYGRLLRKWNLELTELLAAEKDTWIKQAVGTRSGRDLNQIENEAREITQQYVQQLQNLGIGDPQIGKYLHHQVTEQLGHIRSQDKQNQAKFIEAAQRLFAGLKPKNYLQERVFNIFYYLNLYGGTAFLTWLFQKYNPNISILEITHD